MNENIDLKEFVAKRIRHLRLKKGVTQEYLAEKADLGFNYIYRLENKSLNVKIETIEKIMKALDIDIQEFFDIKDLDKGQELTQLISDIETLPQYKKEPTILALRSIIKQIE